MNKKSVISIIVVMALALTGCVGGSNIPSVTSTSAEVSVSDSLVSVDDTKDVSVSEDAAREVEETDDGIKHITMADKKKLSSFIKENYNYGFLLSTYDDIKNVNLTEIFYCGDPSFRSDINLYDRYLELTGDEEIYVDVSAISYEKMNEILLSRTGYDRNEFKTWLMDGINDYDNSMHLFAHGDTNYFTYDIVDGYYDEEGKIVLQVVPSANNNYYEGTGYHISERIVTLEKVGSDYHFVSCRDDIETDVIKQWCYNIVLPYVGSCQLMSYSPREGNHDVTFKIVKNNEILSVFGGNYDTLNIINDKTFNAIIDVDITDLNFDGSYDLVVLAEYMEENNEPSYEYKVYQSESSYFYYMKDLSNEVNENVEPITAVAATAFVKGQGLLTDDWKKAYIDEINSYDTEYPGYTLAYIDDDPIPELVGEGDCEATGAKITTYYDGKTNTFFNDRLYFTYIYKTGLIDNCEGIMGYCWDYVFKLQEGEFNLVAKGTYEEDHYSEPDENGLFGYKYTWNDKPVSKEKYYENLHEVFDSSIAVPGYDWEHVLYKEEMLSLLKVEYSKVY